MRGFRLAVCQLQVGVNKEENLKKAQKKLEEAAREGAQLLILPEMFTCPYDWEVFSFFC